MEGGGAGASAGTAGGGTSSAGQAGQAGSSSAPNKPWDLTGIIGTGQSLSVGANSTPALKTQPYQNLKLALGGVSVPPYDPLSAQLSLVPLVEPIRAATSVYPGPYPQNIWGETPHTAMASQVSASFLEAFSGEYTTVHSVVGESGQPMSVIKKGATDTGSTGHAFAATLFEVEAIARLAASAGKSYGVGAIILTHGESDSGNVNYAVEVAQLWSDYNASLSPLTHQSQTIPLLLMQQHSVPNSAGSTAASTLAQWRAGVDHPGDIICAGPKYQYPYDTDGVHMKALGYELVGEKFGQVYFEKVVRGRDWQPLQPTSVEHAGSLIRVHFHVPVPPLVWDDVLGEPHQAAFTAWQHGRGFEVATKDGTPIEIVSAQIAGDGVELTCSADPGTDAVVRYAMTADGPAPAGGTVRWGKLRDSDPFVGTTTKKAQPNYAVAFELPVAPALP